MDIRAQLLIEHSKKNSIKIRDYIGSDTSKFEELLNLFIGEEYRVSQRAAMAISACFDSNPDLVDPYRAQLIDNLLKKENSVAVKRNSIRILQFMDIPEKYQAGLYDYCLKMLAAEEEPVAIKAFSMLVAYNICKEYPELKNELEIAIYHNIEHNDSPGIRARGKSILKKLAKLD